jgi:hypothetical protein
MEVSRDFINQYKPRKMAPFPILKGQLQPVPINITVVAMVMPMIILIRIFSRYQLFFWNKLAVFTYSLFIQSTAHVYEMWAHNILAIKTDYITWEAREEDIHVDF